jgi:hypothetical protein
MGVARNIAEKINLAEMQPLPDIASTRYCLANPGREYVVYLPEGNEVTVDLSPAKGTLKVTWIHPVDGTIVDGGKVNGGSKRTLIAPFSDHAALWLVRV